jgi:hypothetical protein
MNAQKALERANSHMSIYQLGIENVEKAIKKNGFMESFYWGRHSTLYLNNLIVKRIEGFIAFIDKEPIRTEEWLSRNIKMQTERMIDGLRHSNPESRSTSILSNLCEDLNRKAEAMLLEVWQDVLENAKD